MRYSGRRHGVGGRFLKSEGQISEVPTQEALAVDPDRVERELKVIRVGPNPRVVVCEYWELESRRTCVVNVRDNRKFFKGMRFVMEEPAKELEYLKPWVFEGRLPRRKGRW